MKTTKSKANKDIVKEIKEAITKEFKASKPKAKKETVEKTKKQVKEKVEKKTCEETTERKLNDLEPETLADLLNLYEGLQLEGSEFVGNGYIGINKQLLKQVNLAKGTKLKSFDLEERLIKGYKKALSEDIKSVNDIVKYAKSVKGVCYNYTHTLGLTKTKIKVNSILKLSKWIAPDSRVRKFFKNHRFIYMNDVTVPILFLNEKTQKIDGYIVPNQYYWDTNKRISEAKEIK